VTYLRDNLKPSVDFDSGSSLQHGVADIVVRTVLEPKSEQTKDILQRVLAPERYRLEEGYEG
jgi:hypothetical protein